MTDENLFTFSSEPEPSPYDEESRWQVLSVEDDVGYQQSLKIGLSNLRVKHRGIQFLTANSAAEASTILADNDNIAVVLLDVVMERDDAGLFLINTIRTVLGNSRVRIILLTGQPGMAPRQDTFREYDIDDYWNKVELTEEKLRGIVTSNIKTWSNLHDLFVAKRGLQMIVDASRAITSKQSVGEFTQTVLSEVSRVIGIPETGGIVCAYRPNMASLEHCEVVATSGDFVDQEAPKLASLLQLQTPVLSKGLLDALERALQTQEHQFFDVWSVLYFSTAQVDSNHYLIIVRSPKPLEPNHITLLMVYGENISNGFVNLALLNKLSFLAYFDETLSIPNRHWVQRELQSMSLSDIQQTTVVQLSLPDYQVTELTLGNDYCASLLNSALQQIKQVCSKVQTICYIDDGVFALIYNKEDLPNDESLSHLTDLTLSLNGVEQSVSCCISYLPLADTDFDNSGRILKTAELAHQRLVKRDGAVHAITPQFLRELDEQNSLLKELTDAIVNPDAFFMVFQPKVDLRTGKAKGVEALVRWRNNAGDVVRPDLFIALAEVSGLITRLDFQVMKMSIKAASTLWQNGYCIPVAFNVTCADILSPRFLDNLEAEMLANNVEGKQLEIEITESQAMEDYDEVNKILFKLLKRGINVSIDDFGSGYSSLTHLTTLSASTLKVDKSFIDAIGTLPDGSPELVLEMISQLSAQCKFSLIAEGIETDVQRKVLLDKGYQTGQGYLFAKPMLFDDLQHWLTSHY